MGTPPTRDPQIVHEAPGRLRVHLPGWSGAGASLIEGELLEVPGVSAVRASAATGNVLVCFDANRVGREALLERLRRLRILHPHATGRPPHARDRPSGDRPCDVLRERHGRTHRVRITVRGLDRNQWLAALVVRELEAIPGVERVLASPLTGRALVEYAPERVDVEDIMAEVAALELPRLDDEGRPAHPLEPGPLAVSATRAVGSAVGLALIAARRLAGEPGPAVSRGAPEAAAAVGVVEGVPAARERLRTLLGRDRAEIALGAVGVFALTLSGSPLGLAAMGAGALRLLTEARARRVAWGRYEKLLEGSPDAVAGAEIRLDTGARMPLSGRIVEGHGTAIGADGLPLPVRPGALIPAGARVLGGPFVVELRGEAPCPSPAGHPPPSSLDRYVAELGPLSLGYAAITAVLTRSWRRAFVALVLLNPRTALIGAQAANAGASARALRSGVVVVGSRPDRPIALPDVLLLDSPRVLTDGLAVGEVHRLHSNLAPARLEELAAAVAAAASMPWGRAFTGARAVADAAGGFDGRRATATVGGRAYTLGPASGVALRQAGADPRAAHWLMLSEQGRAQPLGLIALVPRPAAGASELLEVCRGHEVRLLLRSDSDDTPAAAIAAGVRLDELVTGRSEALVAELQRRGERVALVSDSALAGPAFAACDLAIALTSGRSGHFPARADLLAPDPTAVAAVIEAAARRERALRDATALSIASNGLGALWGVRGEPDVIAAARITHVAALAAIADAWLRERGGGRAPSLLARVVDPRPERWGRQSRSAVLRAVDSRPRGLSSEQAERRRVEPAVSAERSHFATAVAEQVRSPLAGLLAGGAAISLAFGAVADVALIGAVILANAAVGAWQEREAGEAAAALERRGAATASVLRDGRPCTVPVREVVRGDVLLLAPGDRVAADARLLRCEGLEVDESALTGESMPVAKGASKGPDESRVVLAGTDVTVGTARAVAVAVGEDTRMGALGAALARESDRQTPLGRRLSLLLREGIPIIAASGALVSISGVLWGRPLLPQLALGASAAVAALPEGLPLMAGAAEAAVARRLATRNALVRRLSVVEALGRVDVACCDKTGTMTEGRLALSLVAGVDGEEARTARRLPAPLAEVLAAAALATPHPGASGAGSHPTDVAVVEGAERQGLAQRLREPRERETAFDPVRSFHATVVDGRLCVKGAPEVLLPRCTSERRDGRRVALSSGGRRRLLSLAQRLAGRGLRVLVVAEGQPLGSLEDPQDLVALGFLGISDPLRRGVAAAVRRCQEGGVRVIMLTGDHPATADTVAREAGLLAGAAAIPTGAEIAELDDAELDSLLERVAVVARITPLDKLRIVESLQRLGHTVAMTGDGVNDAPALRLADVGVAMGKGGTEVARQAADVVLADDDFATLAEALVEGRAFWQNMHRALGLLIGGNLGELGLIAGAGMLGREAPLTTRAILTVNLVTDVLPALAVVVQQPEHRNLAALAREGPAGLGTPLREDILRRGASTALPSLLAYLLAARACGPEQARAVAFASIVATQLAQMLAVGHAEGQLTTPVLGAVAACGGGVVASLTIPPLSRFLELTRPTGTSWAIIAMAAGGALGMGRAITAPATGAGRLPLTGPSHRGNTIAT